MSETAEKNERRFKNYERVKHIPTGRFGHIDGRLSNCPGTYCVDFGGMLNEFVHEDDLQRPPEAK